ncbi:transcriptional repressor [Paraclostridium bifermentans]|uniref:Transcriptional repressor n=1 Tax=Paraclostridium bifermentans TaxID=1490 RepID=A0AA44IGU1_PARBF|nr:MULTISPECIES: transcriptional repressor [Paraclostridium]MBN8046739.1 transcriptional repressor [Paraclostridium bifermentans]MBZ6007273.1 transcriptional repressor [Paraclostridium bifermentans]MDU0295839.1 transcriptional repressor [Paraclostridium sp. MRS3W1]NME09191.1 transcriptional repressor [Paraclostridium bifermentans]
MDCNLEYLKRLISKSGHKVTPQKVLILEVMISSRHHLSAKDIYDKLKQKNIGFATIYRSLNLFIELNIIKKIDIDNTTYYEMKIFSKNPFHIHFKCSKCDSIIDINNKDINIDYIAIIRKVEFEENFQIYDSDIMFTGICDKCKEDIKWQDQQNLDG